MCVVLDDGVGSHHHCQMYCMFHFRRNKLVMDEYCEDGVCTAPAARNLLQALGSSASVVSKHRADAVEGHGEQQNNAVAHVVSDSDGLIAKSLEKREKCHEPQYYCVKMCGSLSANQHLYEKCERSCTGNFDQLQAIWDTYCRCGLCSCGTKTGDPKLTLA